MVGGTSGVVNGGASGSLVGWVDGMSAMVDEEPGSADAVGGVGDSVVSGDSGDNGVGECSCVNWVGDSDWVGGMSAMVDEKPGLADWPGWVGDSGGVGGVEENGGVGDIGDVTWLPLPTGGAVGKNGVRGGAAMGAPVGVPVPLTGNGRTGEIGADSSVRSAITASTLPTLVVSSSWTRISTNTPLTGDGISASTLSVLTSTSGSWRATASPTFFSQRDTVPDETDSPSTGKVTS